MLTSPAARPAALVLALLGLLGIETAAVAWGQPRMSWAALGVTLNDPFALMMLIDFVFMGAFVFYWMLEDARTRGARAWIWLLPLILFPTLALIAFLWLRERAKRVGDATRPLAALGEPR